jgi:hypothetical protein
MSDKNYLQLREINVSKIDFLKIVKKSEYFVNDEQTTINKIGREQMKVLSTKLCENEIYKK